MDAMRNSFSTLIKASPDKKNEEQELTSWFLELRSKELEIEKNKLKQQVKPTSAS